MSHAVSLLLAVACAAGTEIKAGAKGGFDLDARGASVSAVLECLKQETGVRVLNPSGVLPTTRITLSLRGKTEVQLISEVLNESGLNYGLTMNREKTRVESLLLVGLRTKTAGGGSTSGSQTSSARPLGGDMDEERVAPPETDSAQGRGRPNDPGAVGPAVWNPNPSGTSPANPTTEPFPEPRALSPMSLRDSRRASPRSGANQPPE
jgi:hypothetical protein